MQLLWCKDAVDKQSYMLGQYWKEGQVVAKQHVTYSLLFFRWGCFAANMIALGIECLNPHWIKFMIYQGIQNSIPTLPDNTGKRFTSLKHSKTIRQVCVSPWQQLLQLWSYPWWSMCPRAVFQSMIRNAQRQVSVTRFESLEAFQKAMGGHEKLRISIHTMPVCSRVRLHICFVDLLGIRFSSPPEQ